MIRPRVCLISHIYLEKVYRAKLEYLADAVDLNVISPDQFPFQYGLYRADFSMERGYRARVYPCRFPLGVRTSTRWVLASRELGFRHIKPDIIHVENEAHSFSLMQALIYRRLYAPKAKVVVSVWANLRLTGSKGVGLNLLARLMRPGIDFYIAGSAEARALLVESGVPAGLVAVFPLVGVDVNYFAPATASERAQLRRKMGIATNDFAVGYVGRFAKDKGLTDLLSGFRLFQENTRGARLLFVGDGPLKDDLLDQQPEVIVASPGGSSAVLQYYQVMDVLVLPSRTTPHWIEQFGLVMVEAMACGVPVVGSNSGAIPQVIGEAGLVFPEGNVPELTARLRNLYDTPSARAELSLRGLKRALENYSDRRIGEQTLDVYHRLVSSVRPPEDETTPEKEEL